MPKPRKSLISLESTSYYHCVSRCARRAFLIGERYEHRRQWVEGRLAELDEVLASERGLGGTTGQTKAPPIKRTGTADRPSSPHRLF